MTSRPEYPAKVRLGECFQFQVDLKLNYLLQLMIEIIFNLRHAKPHKKRQKQPSINRKSKNGDELILFSVNELCPNCFMKFYTSCVLINSKRNFTQKTKIKYV